MPRPGPARSPAHSLANPVQTLRSGGKIAFFSRAALGQEEKPILREPFGRFDASLGVNARRLACLQSGAISRPAPENGDMAMTNGCSNELSRVASDAKGALERVCSGVGLDPPSRYYSPSFVDHVNDLELRGHEGARRSVELYKAVLPDMAIRVQEQVVDVDRVASRFVVTGSRSGRHVRFNGITVSRFEGGLIVEDWSVTDTLGMLRQLGFWRSFLVGVRPWRALASAGRALPEPSPPSCAVASRRAENSGVVSA